MRFGIHPPTRPILTWKQWSAVFLYAIQQLLGATIAHSPEEYDLIVRFRGIAVDSDLMPTFNKKGGSDGQFFIISHSS